MADEVGPALAHEVSEEVGIQPPLQRHLHATAPPQPPSPPHLALLSFPPSCKIFVLYLPDGPLADGPSVDGIEVTDISESMPSAAVLVASASVLPCLR